MVLDNRGGRPRVRRPALGSVAVVLLVVPLLLAFAVPVFGAAAKKLSDPNVSPRSGSTSTQVGFEVTYSRAMAAAFVRVVISGKNHAMTQVDGGDWSGVGRFRWSGKLPVGT